MNGTQVKDGRDRKYRAILFFVIGLAAISSAMKELSQLHEFATLAGGMVSEWTDALTPSANASTPVVVKSCLVRNVIQRSDEFNWSGVVAQGLAVEVKGVNGDISAEPATGNEVQVVATKKSRRGDVNAVQIKVVQHSGGVTICALYPYEDGTIGACEPGGNRQHDNGSASLNLKHNDVSVDFVVRVPQQVNFIGRTINGEISASGLASNVETHTVNGSVKISTSGYASATTVNGGISARLGSPTWPDSLQFTTVNGEIAVDLPTGVSTDVEAQTLNGAISSEFPLSLTGSKDLKHVKGRIGSGGRQLYLKTLNGSINLRQSS